MYNRQLRWTLLFLLALMTGNVLAQEETVSQPSTAPTVYASETYEIEVTTHIYAQGLTHSDWGSEDAEVMDLHLDVYEPIGAPDNRPVMMIIHGGAFRLGSRDDGRFVSMSEYFASRGWVTISIDYRLAGDFGTFPQSWQDGIQEVVDPSAQDSTMPIYAASRDAKAAVRWVYANAETYQINTDYITALGMSAGASLAIMLGTTDAEIYRDELTVEEDSTLASTNLDQPTDIQTVVAFSMSSAANTLIERIYGINTFDATDAPLIFIHGTNDRIAPFSDAEALRDAYEATGAPYAFYPIEGVGHTLGFMRAEVNGMVPMELGFAFVVEQQALTVAD